MTIGHWPHEINLFVVEQTELYEKNLKFYVLLLLCQIF